MLRNLAIPNQIQWGGLRPKATNQGLFQTLPPQQFDKEKEKKNRPRPEKKEKKKALLTRLAEGAVKVFGIKILPNGWRFLFQNP